MVIGEWLPLMIIDGAGEGPMTVTLEMRLELAHSTSSKLLSSVVFLEGASGMDDRIDGLLSGQLNLM